MVNKECLAAGYLACGDISPSVTHHKTSVNIQFEVERSSKYQSWSGLTAITFFSIIMKTCVKIMNIGSGSNIGVDCFDLRLCGRTTVHIWLICGHTPIT